MALFTPFRFVDVAIERFRHVSEPGLFLRILRILSMSFFREFDNFVVFALFFAAKTERTGGGFMTVAGLRSADKNDISY
jgi:hypothetical protein